MGMALRRVLVGGHFVLHCVPSTFQFPVPQINYKCAVVSPEKKVMKKGRKKGNVRQHLLGYQRHGLENTLLTTFS